MSLNTRGWQLTFVLLTAIAIASAGSHLLTVWLKIETTSGTPWQIGLPTGTTPAVMAGSSLAGDAISWDAVSTTYQRRINGWAVAGSSPWEWETFQRRTPGYPVTYVIVSAYDLNEYYLSDFHADVVPFRQTVEDLWDSHADWHFAKRVLSQYPLKYVRTLFPSAGRSQGIMGGLRERLVRSLGKSAALQAEAGPTMTIGKTDSTKAYKEDRISSWERGTLLRRVATMRGASQGVQAFDGPKKLAFERMLTRGQQSGQVVVVVLPVSPAYARAFLSPDVRRRFESALADVQRRAPDAQWVRLDRLPDLAADDHFWDLVHMNTTGQRLATRAFLTDLDTARPRP